MRVYSYKCKKCGKDFELLLGVTKEHVKKACPECGSTRREKSFSTFGVGKSASKSAPPAGGSCAQCPHGGTCGMG